MCDCPGFVYSARFAQYASNIRGLLVLSLYYCAKQGSRVCASKSGKGANPHFAHIAYMYMYILYILHSRNGHHDIAKCLVIEAHCDPSVKTTIGQTPLHYACQ